MLQFELEAAADIDDLQSQLQAHFRSRNVVYALLVEGAGWRHTAADLYSGWKALHQLQLLHFDLCFTVPYQVQHPCYTAADLQQTSLYSSSALSGRPLPLFHTHMGLGGVV